jgi:hypothetical protein
MTEKFWIWLSRKLPRALAYWAYIRVAVEGNTEYPGDQKVFEPMQRWVSK